MGKSLFFVSKPLELLGAIEARQQFQITDAVLVYSCKEGTDKRTLQFLINKSPKWNTVIFVKNKPYYGFFWVKLIRKLQKDTYQYLFTRSFAASAYFIHNLTYQKHYLLDDGMATITISKKFEIQKNLTKRFSLFKGLNKKGIKYNLIIASYKVFNIAVEKKITTVNFFTFYTLPEVKNQTVVKNNMQWLNELKKKTTPKKENNTVYIIGTNVIGAKIIAPTDYLKTILLIKEYYPSKSIHYIPHIQEKNSFIEKLECNNIIVQKNKYTIELDFLLNNTVPYHIAGTISTALITLKMIYGSATHVDYFNFDSSKISLKNNEILSDIHRYQKTYLNPITIQY